MEPTSILDRRATDTPPPPEPLLLRPTEAARLLGVSRSRCYDLIAAGEVPSVRLGRTLRVPLGRLRILIDERVA